MNGQHFLHYRYRLPLSRVDTLGIFGDILVKAIGFLNINVSSLSGNGPCLPLVPGRAQDPPTPLPQAGPVTPILTKVEGIQQVVGLRAGWRGWPPKGTREQWPGGDPLAHLEPWGPNSS